MTQLKNLEIFLQRYANGQQAYKKMLKNHYYQGCGNQNHH
jgi:hypothetical protein